MTPRYFVGVRTLSATRYFPTSDRSQAVGIAHATAAHGWRGRVWIEGAQTASGRPDERTRRTQTGGTR
jgi:hypothetical protein